MLFPKLKKINREAVIRHGFGGLSSGENVPEGSFADMENLCSDSYPLLSVRPKRAAWHGARYDDDGNFTRFDGIKMVGSPGITAAASSENNLCFCAGTGVYIDGERVEGALLDPNVPVHTMVPFGRNCFIVPEGIYVMRESGGFSVKYAAADMNCDNDCAVYACLEDGGELPEDTAYDFTDEASDGDTAIASSSDGTGLYVFDGESGEWIFSAPVYTAFEKTGADGLFYAGDTVKITAGTAVHGEYKVLLSREGKIVTDAFPSQELCALTVFTVSKSFPEMDLAVERNNRIFGCRAGVNADGESVNEIYVSALGDPLRWDKFEGTSTDSYCASLGTPGEFTGAGVMRDSAVFFKEHSITEITGNTPADFTVRSFPARGVEKGAHLSVVNLNEKLFYKSRFSVNVFDGYLPYSVSDGIDISDCRDPAAGTADGKYYIAMTNGEGKRKLWVFDTAHGTWHRESCDNIRAFAGMRNCLYSAVLEGSDANGLFPVELYTFHIHNAKKIPDAADIFSGETRNRCSYVEENDIGWFAETGVIGANEPETRTLRTLAVRLKTGDDPSFSVTALLDGNKTPFRLYSSVSPVDGTVNIPLRLPRCDFFRLRFEGSGSCVIYSVTYCYEKNTEVNTIVY